MRGVFKAGLCWSCTAAVLSLSLLSCSASKRLTKTQNVDAQMCPPPLKKQTQRVAGEHLAWCLSPDGRMNGPFQARYEDGRPKAFSKLKSGRLDGVYRAWHPNGRRAVRQTYRSGQLTGRRTIWPPNGPPMVCPVGTCSEVPAVLGRPLCQPNHISKVFMQKQSEFDRCLLKSTPSSTNKHRTEKRKKQPRIDAVEIMLSWWINMTGHAYSVSASGHDDSKGSRCMTDVIARSRFPVPFGEPCHVRMPMRFGQTLK